MLYPVFSQGATHGMSLRVTGDVGNDSDDRFIQSGVLSELHSEKNKMYL